MFYIFHCYVSRYFRVNQKHSLGSVSFGALNIFHYFCDSNMTSINKFRSPIRRTQHSRPINCLKFSGQNQSAKSLLRIRRDATLSHVSTHLPPSQLALEPWRCHDLSSRFLRWRCCLQNVEVSLFTTEIARSALKKQNKTNYCSSMFFVFVVYVTDIYQKSFFFYLYTSYVSLIYQV